MSTATELMDQSTEALMQHLSVDDFCRRIMDSSKDFGNVPWDDNSRQRLTEAVAFALKAHDGAFRKGTKIPYIYHPVEAACVVASLTDDIDTLVAAVLHDVAEDTEYTLSDIQDRFGARVAELVSYESEDKMKDIPAEDSWKKRKEIFLAHLGQSPVEAKQICLGDKLSNMRLTVKTYREKGDAMWQAFNQKNPREQGWYYRSIAKELDDFSGTEAWKEYNRLCDEVFGSC